MTPTQVLNHLASVLFERVNRDINKNECPIAVRLGYGNRLKVPAGLDQGNCDAGMSAGFISLWLNSSNVDCKASAFCEVEGVMAQITEVINEARITIHAQRCGSFDLLHRLKMEFCHTAIDLDLHEDIVGTPTFGNIIDVTALGQGDEFEDRAESVLTVKFRDRTAKATDCITLCSQEIQKETLTTEQETELCH